MQVANKALTQQCHNITRSASAANRGTGGWHFLKRDLGGRGFLPGRVSRSTLTGVQSRRYKGLAQQLPRWATASVAAQPRVKRARLRATCLGARSPGAGGRGSASAAALKGLALSSTGRSAPACAGLSTNPCRQQVSAYQPATDTAAALREETPSHYVTEERRSRNPSFTKPSRQIQRLTH